MSDSQTVGHAPSENCVELELMSSDFVTSYLSPSLLLTDAAFIGAYPISGIEVYTVLSGLQLAVSQQQYYTPTALALHQSTLSWSTLGQLTPGHRETRAAVPAVGDWKHLCMCRECSIGRHSVTRSVHTRSVHTRSVDAQARTVNTGRGRRRLGRQWETGSIYSMCQGCSVGRHSVMDSATLALGHSVTRSLLAQAQGYVDDLAENHTNVLRSRFESVRQFE